MHVGAKNLYRVISNFTLAVIRVKHSQIAINIQGKKLGPGCHFDVSDSIELCIVELTRIACIRFQPVKCNMMQLTRKRIKKIHASYTLDRTVIENVESTKYLGVTIANDLHM